MAQGKKRYPLSELRKKTANYGYQFDKQTEINQLLIQCVLELDKRYSQLDGDIENIIGVLEMATDSEGKTLPNAIDQLKSKLEDHRHEQRWI